MLKEKAQKKIDEEREEAAVNGIKRRLNQIQRKEKDIKELENQIEKIESGELTGNEDLDRGCTISGTGCMTLC